MTLSRFSLREALWDDTWDSGKTQILSQMKLKKAKLTVLDFRIKTEMLTKN